eukprot:2703486-Rhodomonas_salina.1
MPLALCWVDSFGNCKTNALPEDCGFQVSLSARGVFFLCFLRGEAGGGLREGSEGGQEEEERRERAGQVGSERKREEREGVVAREGGGRERERET